MEADPTTIDVATYFSRGTYVVNIDGSTWKDAFSRILAAPDKYSFAKSAIHQLWTVNGGHLRRNVADDDLLLKILELTLPGYSGNGLVVYRGECSFLYDVGKVGFCWTNRIDVATKFARGLNAIESDGVLVEAYAPPDAILAPPNSHSSQQMEEFEYTCNPWRLEKIREIIRFPKCQNS